jgi:drug/metabolite transporter (DMT)-like permease
VKGERVNGGAILLAIAAAAAWAIGMTAAKPAVRHIDRLTYMLGRWAVVATLALVYAGFSRSLSFPGLQPVGMAALAGLLDATFGGLFFLMAMERAPAYQTTTLSSTAPIWGVAGAFLFLGEPLRWSLLVAAGLAVVGTYLLAGSGRRGLLSARSGTLLALLTGVLWGVAETVPTKLALDGGLAPAATLFVFSIAGGIGALLLLPLLRRTVPRRVDGRGIAWMLLSAVAGAFLGWLLWLRGLESAPASLLSPIRGSTMLFAFLYSVAFLKERPTWRSLVGVALVLSGVLWVSLGTS